MAPMTMKMGGRIPSNYILALVALVADVLMAWILIAFGAEPWLVVIGAVVFFVLSVRGNVRPPRATS